MQKSLLILLLFISKTLFSQVNDNFEDGDFSTSPSWNGNIHAFSINETKQLQTLHSSTGQTVFLSTPNELSLDVRWQFFIELDFNPSSQNQARIYLTADNANLSGSLNGYFVQIGENDTTDSYDLYRQNGTTITKIIDGPPKSRSNSTKLKANVLVTRDRQGNWELKTSIDNTGFYTSEGNINDRMFTSGHYSGICCKYTSTNSGKFIFDDFVVEPIETTDNQPPKLLSVNILDSVTLQVKFDKALNPNSSTNIYSYSLNNNYGNPLEVYPLNDSTIFNLKFSRRFQTGNYTLSVTGVRDLNNTPIAENTSLSFEYQLVLPSKRGDLVINEIFADPTPQIDLPGVEFVEILNTTSQTIDLKGWSFCDESRSVTLQNVVIRGGEYLILCAKADTSEFKLFGTTIGLSPWPILNNAGDFLTLISPENITIDSVAYSDSWYQNTTKKQGGWTLERIDPLSNCTGVFNWTASTDATGGTPGKVNSVYQKDYDQLILIADSIKQTSDSTLSVFFNKPLDANSVRPEKFALYPSCHLHSASATDDLRQVDLAFNRFLPNTNYQLSVQGLLDCAGNSVSTDMQSLSFVTEPAPPVPSVRTDTSILYITEIFADPSPEVGLPLEEFVEIYNPGKDTVNLEGWTLNDLSTKGKINKGIILPGEYLILCSLADTTTYQPSGRVAGISPWPSLNNTSDQVTLKSHTGRTVDSIAYRDSWYQSIAKKQGGWTLERIDISSTCSGFYNWRGSKDKQGGTPGSTNSYSNYNTSSLSLDSVSLSSDSTLVVFLNSMPDTTTLQPVYFSVDQGIGLPEKIVIDQNDCSTLLLSFNTHFDEGRTYLLTVLLNSCSGTPIDPPNNTITFAVPELPHYEYPVVINEIFPDPSPLVGLPEAEFIELYNPTSKRVSLNGLTYEDSSNTQYKFTSGEIESNGYLILCSIKDTLNFKPFGKVIGINPWPTLNNDKDVLILKDNKGFEIHRVSYNINWYKDKEKQEGGYSLEMINPSSICSGIQNWASSKDLSGGTPGKENSVLTRIAEVQPLALLTATLTDSITITLSFNKTVDSLSAADQNNYVMNNGMSGPLSALPIAPNFDKVALTFPTLISRGKNYRITVSNVKDCTGNLIASNLNEAEFIYAEKIERGNILVSELLFNPRPNGVDFVEIYNNSSKTLDLNELALATTNDKDSLIQTRIITNSSFLFEPNQYLVLTANPDNIKSEYSTEAPQAFLKMSSLPSFNDDSGVAVLITGTNRIDQFDYSTKMHFSLIKDPEGVSLERVSMRTATNEVGNFRSAAASVGYATPGYKNSQYVEELNIQEAIELVSKSFSPDNDGFEDALIVNYHFKEAGMIANASIYNDQGALIKKLTRNQSLAAEGILSWDGLNEVNEKAPVGIYLIYLEVFDLTGSVKKYRKNFVLATKLE